MSQPNKRENESQSPQQPPQKVHKRRLNFTPAKLILYPNMERALFDAYEAVLRVPKMTGRGCYIVRGYYITNDVKTRFVKIGYTDSFFSYYCPIQEKMIKGRLYSIITDLRYCVEATYAKIEEILAFYKELPYTDNRGNIRNFEQVLLTNTEEYKLTVGNKCEYRSGDKEEEMMRIANELYERCSVYFERVV